jgi:hypothetical protein
MTLAIGSIVLASVYFAVAWITKKASIGFDRRERVLWTAIALALLGINKLFEGALTSVGRLVAFDQGTPTVGCFRSGSSPASSQFVR